MEGIAFDESIIMTRFIAHNRSDHHIIYQNGFVLLCFVPFEYIFPMLLLKYLIRMANNSAFLRLRWKFVSQYLSLHNFLFCFRVLSLYFDIVYKLCTAHRLTDCELFIQYSIELLPLFVCFLLQVIFQMIFPFVDFANAIGELVYGHVFTKP